MPVTVHEMDEAELSRRVYDMGLDDSDLNCERPLSPLTPLAKLDEPDKEYDPGDKETMPVMMGNMRSMGPSDGAPNLHSYSSKGH